MNIVCFLVEGICKLISEGQGRSMPGGGKTHIKRTYTESEEEHLWNCKQSMLKRCKSKAAKQGKCQRQRRVKNLARTKLIWVFLFHLWGLEFYPMAKGKSMTKINNWRFKCHLSSDSYLNYNCLTKYHLRQDCFFLFFLILVLYHLQKQGFKKARIFRLTVPEGWQK